MGAAWAWARSELRRRRRATVALALLIGVSGAVVLTAAAGARRTDSAFSRFLESNDSADVQLQYSATNDIDDKVLEALRRHPDVETVAPAYITVAFSEDSDYDLLLLASPGPELFRDVDRPRVLEGRLPDPAAADEILVTRFAKNSLGVRVGDIMTVGTFGAEQFDAQGFEDEPSGPVLELRVVGVAITAYDVADPEFAALFATPAYFDSHWGQVGGFGPSMQVTTRGDRDPSTVVREAIAGFDFEESFLTSSSELTAKVEDGTRVLAIGLATFATVAGLAALVACAQALHRRVAEAASDLPALRAMGLSRGQRSSAMGLTIAPVVVAGVLLAVVLAIPASGAMPIGAARSAEPHPGIDIDGQVLLVGAALFTVTLLLAAGLSASRVGRRALHGQPSEPHGRRRPGRARLLGARLSPPSHLGVAMALEPGVGPTAVPVRSTLIGAAVGAAGVVAVLTFGASLDSLVREPARSGWNWTFAPDDLAEDDLAEVMAIPGVDDVGRLVHRQVVVDGEQMLAIAVESDKGTPSLTVLRGRMPTGSREIAVGPKLADRSELGLGDAIGIEDPGGGGTRDMAVVGEVLFPTFDDDNAFNDGVALAPGVIDELAQSDGFDKVIVGFDPTISTDEAARRLTDVVPGSLSIYAYPALPADVANLDAVRFLPRLLGLFLGLLALTAVGHALTTSVHRRRRDLGIVRSLGFRGVDIARTIAAQSLTLIVTGLVVGIPMGIVIGRLSWRLVAEGIGVSATPTIPPVALVAVVLGALLGSGLLAVLPARAAARLRAVDALRAE